MTFLIVDYVGNDIPAEMLVRQRDSIADLVKDAYKGKEVNLSYIPIKSNCGNDEKELECLASIIMSVRNCHGIIFLGDARETKYYRIIKDVASVYHIPIIRLQDLK